MTPELEAASEAAHKMKDSEDSGDDQDYRDFDRTVELGYLVEAVSGLCRPHLRLLTDIADALYAIDEGQESRQQALKSGAAKVPPNVPIQLTPDLPTRWLGPQHKRR